MPEMPDIVVYIEAIDKRILHRRLEKISPDFSPAFEAKQPRWYCMLGLRLKTPQTYPLRYVEETEGA